MTDFRQAAGVVEPSRGAQIAPTVPNALAIRARFNDMRIAMAIDSHSRRTAGHDWFENRAGGMENFNRLQEHVLNPNFAGDASFPKEAVDRLRTTMSASNYNPAEVERMVRGIVTHASIPTDSGITREQSQQLQNLIERTVPSAQEPAARQQPVVPPRVTPTR